MFDESYFNREIVVSRYKGVKIVRRMIPANCYIAHHGIDTYMIDIDFIHANDLMAEVHTICEQIISGDIVNLPNFVSLCNG